MKCTPSWCWLLLFLLLAPGRAEDATQSVVVATVEGPIIPVVEAYLTRTLRLAESKGAILVVELDTPGGLVDTTRNINRLVLAADVPVVCYVAPRGARAASAGVYMLYASHVAAAAPGTHLGSATPVELGGETGEAMQAKMVQDMKAYLRNLAQLRGRNAEWAEESVGKGVALTAEEALQLKVIDLVCSDRAGLLRALQGREVELGSGRRLVLRPDSSRVESLPMSASERALAVFSSPQLAMLMLMVGLYLLVYGLLNAGTYVPELVGAICLLMGLYSLGQLPVNYTGVALLALAVVLFLAELKAPTGGALALGGAVVLALGALFLVPPEYPFWAVSRRVIVVLALFSGAFFGFVARAALKAQARLPVHRLEGARAVALEELQPEGLVRLDGEIWRARSVGERISKGAKVEVVGRDGLVLLVATESEVAGRREG